LRKCRIVEFITNGLDARERRLRSTEQYRKSIFRTLRQFSTCCLRSCLQLVYPLGTRPGLRSGSGRLAHRLLQVALGWCRRIRLRVEIHRLLGLAEIGIGKAGVDQYLPLRLGVELLERLWLLRQSKFPQRSVVRTGLKIAPSQRVIYRWLTQFLIDIDLLRVLELLDRRRPI